MAEKATKSETPENWIWILEDDPKPVTITDREGNKREADLDAVRKHSRLMPGLVRRTGIGNLFFGGPLGRKGELEARGNEYVTNTQIIRALGYVKGAQLEEYVPKETQDED